MKKSNSMKVKIILTLALFLEACLYASSVDFCRRTGTQSGMRTSEWQDIIFPWFVPENTSPVRLF